VITLSAFNVVSIVFLAAIDSTIFYNPDMFPLLDFAHSICTTLYTGGVLFLYTKSSSFTFCPQLRRTVSEDSKSQNLNPSTECFGKSKENKSFVVYGTDTAETYKNDTLQTKDDIDPGIEQSAEIRESIQRMSIELP
jgi:hypothetical protein